MQAYDDGSNIPMGICSSLADIAAHAHKITVRGCLFSAAAYNAALRWQTREFELVGSRQAANFEFWSCLSSILHLQLKDVFSMEADALVSLPHVLRGMVHLDFVSVAETALTDETLCVRLCSDVIRRGVRARIRLNGASSGTKHACGLLAQGTMAMVQ